MIGRSINHTAARGNGLRGGHLGKVVVGGNDNESISIFKVIAVLATRKKKFGLYKTEQEEGGWSVK